MRPVRLTYLIIILLCGASVATAQAPLPFRNGDLFTYLDADLEPAFQQSWKSAGPFIGKFAIVQEEDQLGVIDQQGRYILTPEYEEVHLGSQWRVKKDAQWQLYCPSEAHLSEECYLSISPMQGGLFRIQSAGGFGLMDSAGVVLLPPTFEWLDHLYHEDGYFTDLVLLRTDSGLGLTNWCGEVMLPPHYQRIGLFANGRAVVMKDYKFGVIDLEGQLVVPCEYENIYAPSEGLIPAKLGNRWGFMDLDGNVVIPFRYSAVNNAGFFEGRAAVELRGEWVIIDRQGKEELFVSQPWIHLGEVSEGLIAAAQLDEAKAMKYGYVDPDGRERIPFEFDKAFSFSDGLAVIGQRRLESNTVIKPVRYGVIDRKGRVVLPPVLEHLGQAENLRDSLAQFGSIAWYEGLRRYRLHKDGRKTGGRGGSLEKLLVRYDEVRCTASSPIAVRKDDKWGFSDARGHLVIPNKYDKVECFSNGLAKVWCNELGDGFFYIDPQGREYLCKTGTNK